MRCQMVTILDPNGNQVRAEHQRSGRLVKPRPSGNPPTLWQADDRFLNPLKVYPGCLRATAATSIEDGYVVVGRVDDVINVAGHRLSTGGWKRSCPRQGRGVR